MNDDRPVGNQFDQQYMEVPISELVELPDNPRIGDLELLDESMRELGFYGACIVDRDTMTVLAGNHRLEAARSQGLDVVPALLVDGAAGRGDKIALVDNHSNDRATYAVHNLLARLQGLGEDLAGTGYTSNDVADLLAVVTADVPMPSDLDAPPDEGDAIDDVQDYLSVGKLTISDVPIELLEQFRAVPGADDLARLRYLLANVALPGMPDEDAADGG